MPQSHNFIPPSVPIIETLIVPSSLPIASQQNVLARAISNNQVVIICGETGSGKSTQIAKICLSIGRGRGMGGKGLIGHTQPRRLAASTIAKRLASELLDNDGNIVGFKIRFTDTVKPSASIKIMTDGILLAEIQSDRLLSQYDTLIIDEAHERNLNIDFLLGYLSQILLYRIDLKLIIMSATINADRFADFFSSVRVNLVQKKRFVPVVKVSGRTYPIEIRYRPVEDGKVSQILGKNLSNAEAQQNILFKKNDSNKALYDALRKAIDELINFGPGDILIFLSGEREIVEVNEYLCSLEHLSVDILSLFSALPEVEQNRVFFRDSIEIESKRRIVLATNIAETSVTVPGIRYVIDTGYAKLKRYSYRNKIEKLSIEKISRASANQRAGRCGRIGFGICIRLYSELDFSERKEFTDPEILRSSLSNVILKLKALGLGDPEQFPFIDKPSSRAFNDGIDQLFELGAFSDEKGRLSSLSQIGKQLSQLPLDPCIGRMILEAKKENCLSEILIIAAALSIQDLYERPFDAFAKANAAHRMFVNKKSDFLAYVNLWYWCQDQRRSASSKRVWETICFRQFLSVKRILEWQELHHQLQVLVTKRYRWHCNTSPCSYEQCHRAILSGLLNHVGFRALNGDYYLGKKNVKFFPLPGSIFYKKKPNWIISAELIDNKILYGKTLAVIDPKWLEDLASHLIRQISSNPKWDKKVGQVIALQQATLYGLLIYKGRRVHFGKKICEQQEARKIFIQEALVEDDIVSKLDFILENKLFLEICEKAKHYLRRPILSLESDDLFDFYNDRIPENIIDLQSLEKWYYQEKKKNEKLLCLNQFFLLPGIDSEAFKQSFPKYFFLLGYKFRLHYYFDPNSEEDGVSVDIPLFLLNQIEEKPFEWLVPGMLTAKVSALIKSLSIDIRKAFVPIASYLESFRASFFNVYNARSSQIEPIYGLFDALIKHSKEYLGLSLLKNEFDLERLDKYHFMNFHLINKENNLIRTGRNLDLIKKELSNRASEEFDETVRGIIRSGVDFSLFLSEKPNLAEFDESLTSENTINVKADLRLNIDQRFMNWNFRILPKVVSVPTTLGKVVAYPALFVDGELVGIKMLESRDLAYSNHYLGCRQLFFRQFLIIFKKPEKIFPQWKKILLNYSFLPGATEKTLIESTLKRAIEKVFLSESLPWSQEQFLMQLEKSKSNLKPSVDNFLKDLEIILMAYRETRNKISLEIKDDLLYRDVEEQLSNLFQFDFIESTPNDVFPHLGRYLKAINRRISNFSINIARDRKLYNDLGPILDMQRAILRDKELLSNPDCKHFRWAVEELRVSLFAQNLGTVIPVSIKRVLDIAKNFSSII